MNGAAANFNASYVYLTYDQHAARMCAMLCVCRNSTHTSVVIMGMSVVDPKRILILLWCVGGIYTFFIVWAMLQERVTSQPYESGDLRIQFKAITVLNLVQVRRSHHCCHSVRRARLCATAAAAWVVLRARL